MSSINKVILIGHLGADPEVRYLPGGDHVVNLRLATSETWKDKQGARQEATEWHRVTYFGKTAEVCGQFLKKGSQIYVEGKIVTKKYTDKDGVEKYSTEIRGDRMQMLGGNGQRTEQSGGNSASKPAQNEPPSGDFDDDIPF